MTNLVHRLFLGSIKRSVAFDSTLLKEKPYLIARVQEILVASVVIVARNEFCLLIVSINVCSVAQKTGSAVPNTNPGMRCQIKFTQKLL